MILKGNLIWAPELDRLEVRRGAYLVARGETIVGVYDRLPPEYAGQPVRTGGRPSSSPLSTTCTSTPPSFPTGASGTTCGCWSG